MSKKYTATSAYMIGVAITMLAIDPHSMVPGVKNRDIAARLGLDVRVGRQRHLWAGLVSVITVISLIQGWSRSVSDQFSGLGGNGLTVGAYNEIKDAVRGKSSFLRFDDVEPWRVHVDGIRDLSPVFVPGFSEVRDTSNTNPACSPGCG